MKSSEKHVKLIIGGGLLLIIVLATVVVSFHLVSFNPVYRAGTNSTDVLAAELNAGNNGAALIKDTLRSDQSVVAVVQSAKAKAEDIDYTDIKAMVTKAVSLAGGFGGLIKDGMTVVIKPNLVTSTDYTLPGWTGKPLNPEVNGTTTDYRVTRAIVELVRKYNKSGKVYVMEGSSANTKQCMQQLNYTSEYIPGVDEFIAIEDDSGSWRDYNSDKLVKVNVKDHLVESEVYMNKRYHDADVIISVPCLKTHWTEVVSGSVKNVGIGATPATIYGGQNQGDNNRTTGLNHDKTWLDKWIHDWFMARPVNFAIIDGLQGIQNGPTPCYEQTRTTDIKQDQMNTRLILASRDCVAADTVESLIMEWDPSAVGYLGYLEKSKAGISNISGIRVVGKRVDEVRKNFKGTAPKGKFTDLTPPNVKVKSSGIKNNTLSIDIESNSKTQKVEVYTADAYSGTFIPSNPYKFTITIPNIDKSKTAKGIDLKIYDKYLNYTDKKINIE